jgi:hypothetical protein
MVSEPQRFRRESDEGAALPDGNRNRWRERIGEGRGAQRDGSRVVQCGPSERPFGDGLLLLPLTKWSGGRNVRAVLSDAAGSDAKEKHAKRGACEGESEQGAGNKKKE